MAKKRRMLGQVKILLIGSLYSLGVFINGCATQAQLKLQHMHQQATENAKSVAACIERVRASDVGQRLQRILIMGENDSVRFEKMTIDRLASEAERKDFLDYQAITLPCRTQLIEGSSKVHPIYVNLWAKIFAENDEMALKLIKGDITIGAFNAWLNKVFPLRRQASAETWTEIVRQFQNAHAYELEQRAAATKSLQQWSYQQQLLQQNQQIINRVNRPVYSNCYFIGNIVNCTSY